jgi:hypothetical protein
VLDLGMKTRWTLLATKLLVAYCRISHETISRQFKADSSLQVYITVEAVPNT